MLPLDDPKWSELDGGFRLPYDASVALKQLEAGEDVWGELAAELHNQGDVGEASYAAVPHLVRIAKGNSARDVAFYRLVTAIELQRHREQNPPIPDWLSDDYRAALRELLDVAFADLTAAEDAERIRSILAAMAVAKGQLKYGALLNQDETEITQMLEQFDAWSELLRLTGATSEASEASEEEETAEEEAEEAEESPAASSEQDSGASSDSSEAKASSV